MVGYSKEDLNNMIIAIAVALGPHPKLTNEERVNLNKAQDFLEELWAEEGLCETCWKAYERKD